MNQAGKMWKFEYMEFYTFNPYVLSYYVFIRVCYMWGKCVDSCEENWDMHGLGETI